MISKVLSKAVHEIRDYRERMPRGYMAVAHDLNMLVAEIDRMIGVLETPPDQEGDSRVKRTRKDGGLKT